MTWRRTPPVYSPADLGSLARGTGAALALVRPSRDELAREISNAFQARDTLLTDSGTSALVLAIRATVPRGEIVALPGYACVDVIAAAIGANVRVALYDLVPETMSPDLDSVRAVLSQGARALVVAPLFGYPPDMAQLAEVAAERGVPLIEDAAQSAGGTLHSKRLGAFGDLSVLSFGRGKGMTTGSGGALLVRRAEFSDVVRKSTALGATQRGWRDVIALAAQWVLARPELYALPASIPALKLGEMVYRPPREPGALSAAAAGMLRSALARDAGEVRRRQTNAAQLLALLDQTKRFAPVQALPGAAPGYLRLAMLDLTGTANAEPGLGAARGYPITLDEHPQTRRVLITNQAALKGARALRDRLFTLPTHSRVTRGDVARIAGWLGAREDAPTVGLRPKQAV